MPEQNIRYLTILCILIASLTLSSVFTMVGYLIGVAVIVLVTCAWCFFSWRNLTIGSVLCMLILVLGISLGAILAGPQSILLLSLLSTIAAWDLAAFSTRLSKSAIIANNEMLIHTHLLRLVSVLTIGLVLPLLAFGLQIELKFWQVLFLGILLLLGLTQVFAQLKRSNN